jgi:very-short-patch-repair endonuclease
MKVLDNNSIHYEHELPCGRYFIDLALEKQKIALEIDGKQHEYLDRKASDAKKDKFLVDNGWRVYRIKWKSINNESGKIYIKEQIDKFLQFIQV